MTFLYDILLNFNINFYEFFEWEKDDKIYHIKKIPLFKVNTKFMEDLFANRIKLNDNFYNLISNKTEVFEGKKIKILKYSCIFTDGYKVIGILYDKELKLSDLLLDEANDAINISKRCNILDIEYNIMEPINLNYFETRKELKLKNDLKEEIDKIYKDKDINKLKYLYFEYSNKNINNIDKIYVDLINSLDSINIKHKKLFDLIKLSKKLVI